MRRITLPERKGWQRRVEESGLTFHSRDDPYWNEGVAYECSEREIETLERAANEVHELFLKAAQHVVDNNLFSRLALDERAAELATRAWNADELHLYGRFDFLWDGIGAPKMLEYNADTPTSLLEAAVTQWHWLEDVRPRADQLNSLHERLIERWRKLGIRTPVAFTTDDEFEEDVMTTAYLRDTAEQAGLATSFIALDRIGHNPDEQYFLDEREAPIRTCFKLYPREHMLKDAFGEHVAHMRTRFIEPAWKMFWSNKGMLPILWELFPDHPNLLEASTRPLKGEYVEKPIYGREGKNVTIVRNDGKVATEGQYGAEGSVYQRFHPVRLHDGRLPVLGLWMVGDECAGMGIRESQGLVTDNLSRFTPHYFE